MATRAKRGRRLQLSKPQIAMLSLLLILCVLPIIGGAIRLTQLATGAEITEENARFFAAPIPVVIHIISSLFYCVVGAFQFIPSIRRWQPRLHRLMGRVLLPSGIAAALSALWMTLFYPPSELGSGWLDLFRLIFGSMMLLFLCLAYLAIRQRDFKAHGRWMIRAYAIGIGAGTQAFTLTAGMVFLGGLDGFSNAMLMALGWVMNMIIAEWLIQRSTTRRRKTMLIAQQS